MIQMLNMKEIRSHTGLRGWAAIIVVLVHFRSFIHPSIDPDEMTSFLSKGYLWVDFFFILSGFVMSYIYRIEHPKPRAFCEITHYLIARFARIYPLHLISLVAVFLFFFLAALINWDWESKFCCVFDDSLRSAEALIANLFLVHAWGMFDWVTWNLPSWSLSAELFCYLIFAALLAIDGKDRKLVLVVLSFVVLFYYSFSMATNSDVDENFRLSAVRAASAFLIGIVLFLMRRLISSIPDHYLTYIQIEASITLLLALHFGITDVISIGLMALIVLVTWEDRGALCKLLTTRPLYTAGLFSFSIYMWHYLIKFIAQNDWEYYTGLSLQSSAMGSMLFVACLLVLVIPISVWSYRFLEMPARKWIIVRFNSLIEVKYATKHA